MNATMQSSSLPDELFGQLALKRGIDVWCLQLGSSLELGAWDLELCQS